MKIPVATLSQSPGVDEPAIDSGQQWTTRHFVVLLAGSLLAAFPKIAFGAHTLFYRDFGAMWYPVYSYTRDSILRGEIPVWNPYVHCGVPFQAQMGQWYPPLLASMLLPMPWSLNALFLVHLFFGGLGMYWLARRLNLGSFASSFAGMAFMFNGVVLSSLLWLSYISCLAWMPWVVGLVMTAWREGGKWVPCAALCVGVQLLTGMPELTLLTWVCLGLMWCTQIFRKEVAVFSSLSRLFVVVLLGAGIAMIQLLPFLDLISHSQRDRNYGTTAWSMPGWGWANLLVPLFHCYQAPQGPWFQPGQDLLPSYYLGAAVVVLGLVAPFLLRSSISRGLVGLACFCYVMALGSDGVLYNWVRKVFPWIGFARYPVKFAILPAFLLPIAAALTIEHLQQSNLSKNRRWLGGLGLAALAIIGLILLFAFKYPFPDDQFAATTRNAGVRIALMLVIVGGLLAMAQLGDTRKRILIQLLVLAILPIDAMTHSPDIAPTLPCAAFDAGVWQASGKPAPPELGEGRIMLSHQAERLLNFSRVKSQNLDFTGKRLAEWYNYNLLDRLAKVNGAMPLRPAAFDRIEQGLYGSSAGGTNTGLLDFLSVAWISSAENPTEWNRRSNALPVITAGQRAVFASDDETLVNIVREDFDPRKVVYLPQGAKSVMRSVEEAKCSVMNSHLTGQRVEADVEASGPSMVVLSQSFYHLWRATVDEQPVSLLRANFAFQALEVPLGKHHIVLSYEDYNLRLGKILSAVALTVCIWLWVRQHLHESRHACGEDKRT